MEKELIQLIAYIKGLEAAGDGGQTADAGGGFYVGWTSAGEWLEYTVDVAAAGDYDADGMSAAALLTLGLRELGGRVEPFVPHRTWGPRCADRVRAAGGRGTGPVPAAIVSSLPGCSASGPPGSACPGVRPVRAGCKVVLCVRDVRPVVYSM